MTDKSTVSDTESEEEVFPVQPRYHPLHKIPRLIYDFLASAKLAIVLLVIILVCCLAGVTIWRGKDAWTLIFDSLWFNGILVLLVVNIACCFFGRVWRRRLTLVSFGMILFHLSFVTMLLAIIYNSLFFFRGTIRLTEGETLESGNPLSYDEINKGRFFDFSRITGGTTLIKMHTGYKVSGNDKRAAYEVALGEEGALQKGIIYITHKMTYRGFDYFNDREGYSLLLALSDKQGKDLYGAHAPLQSIRSSREHTEYSTGYRDWEKLEVMKGEIPFPFPPEKTLFALRAMYEPSKLQERSGDVHFVVHPLDGKGNPDYSKKVADEKVAIGTPVPVGEYLLTAKEVRYWVVMLVRYEPGKPFVLTSLWVSLAGMILTTIGRMLRSRRQPN
jgi:hypothetical protein